MYPRPRSAPRALRLWWGYLNFGPSTDLMGIDQCSARFRAAGPLEPPARDQVEIHLSLITVTHNGRRAQDKRTKGDTTWSSALILQPLRPVWADPPIRPVDLPTRHRPVDMPIDRTIHAGRSSFQPRFNRPVDMSIKTRSFYRT